MKPDAASEYSRAKYFVTRWKTKTARLHSVLTVVGGKVVYAEGPFAPMAPPALPVSPDWSPVKTYGGYGAWGLKQQHAAAPPVHACCSHGTPAPQGVGGFAQNVREAFWGPGSGCSCWAF